MAEEKFPVNPTQTLADWRAFHIKNGDFDDFHFKEIREDFLKRINPDSRFDWLSERVEAYLEINDFETVLMLLRQFSRLSYYQKEAVALMVKSANKILEYSERTGYSSRLKEVIVILCGKINFYKEVYDDSVASIFEKILNKYYPSCYGSDEDKSRLISRILLPIAHVKDRYFLPILKEKEPSKKELDHLMQYTSVSKDRIELEALRLLVIKHLEN